MRSLSDSVRRLAAMRAAAMITAPPGTDRLSDLDGFGSNPGALGARLYTPVDLPEGAPLVVVLHGCTQTAAAYDHGAGWSKLADEAGFAVLFPEQRRANNANLCFNWFVPGDTRRDRGEALSIRQMVEHVATRLGSDAGRIYVTGLSAGGAMATVMLATYPEIFAGGGIVAGLPFGSATSVPEAFERMRANGGPDEAALQDLLSAAAPRHKGRLSRLSLWQGTADHTVDAANLDLIVGQWRGVLDANGVPRSTAFGRHERRVWTDADGNDVIEAFTLTGMGHGTPIDADDGIGAAGPYMLDIGVSSTRHMAAFWGIATEVPADAAHVAPARPHLAPMPRPMFAVGEVIENAMRAAGLVR